MSKLTYQPHIDGLRTVAVLSVVIYHINNDWLPGGFVGVDIFFVISGFLITKIINNAIQQDNFSLKVFYTRRIKRILPVYFLVSSISIIFAWFLFFPRDLIGFSDSLLASTFFVSNFYFWKTTGYFSTAIELKPLVHTWSLSVEEQFYVFWPLTLIVIFKIKNAFKRKVVLGILLTWSTIFSYVLSNYDPNFAYYSIFTRVFELLIGAIAAIYSFEVLHKSKASSYLGFFLIVVSLTLIDHNMTFPGLIALLPCIGATLIVLSGGANTFPIKVLQSKLFVSIGLISYSLYMWHWPILAFAKYYFTVLSLYHLVASVILMFALSYLTRYTIEQRFIRNHMGFGKSVLYLFVLPALFFTLIAHYVTTNNGVKSRFSSSDISLIEQTYFSSTKCGRGQEAKNFEDKCLIKSPIDGPKKRVLLWGDSHAEHFSKFFEAAAKNEALEVYQMYFNGCPPIAGIYRINRTYSDSCYEHNNKVLKLLLSGGDFDYVALAANWSNYPLGNNLADDNDKSINIANSERSFYVNLRKQFRELSAHNVRVLFLNSVPNFKSNASQCQLKHSIFGYPNYDSCVRKLSEVSQDRAVYDEFLNTTIRKDKNVSVLDFSTYFCPDGICTTFINGNMLYRDQNHITDFASRDLYDEVLKSNKSVLSLFEKSNL